MSERITKQQLVDQVSTQSGVSKKDATEVISSLIDVIMQNVKEGNEVVLTGFGIFKKTLTKARTGRNPSTGEPIQIAEMNKPSFKAGSSFKKYLN